MLDRAGYRALPLGDFDRFQQSSLGFLGAQKGCLSPERGSVGPGADVPQSWSSCLCHGIISFLGFLLLLLTFPISGWFALKPRLKATAWDSSQHSSPGLNVRQNRSTLCCCPRPQGSFF